MFYNNYGKHVDQMASFTTRKNSAASAASSSSPYSSSLILGGFTPGQPGPIIKVCLKFFNDILRFAKKQNEVYQCLSNL